MQLFALLNNN